MDNLKEFSKIDSLWFREYNLQKIMGYTKLFWQSVVKIKSTQADMKHNFNE